MSLQLISRNPDLQRLQNEGYSVEIVAGHLVVRDVPYVNSRREIHSGVLVSTLEMSGDRTNRPAQHVSLFAGEHPCKADGTRLDAIAHSSGRQAITPDLVVDHSFSSKPSSGYSDYFHKMSTYAAIISGPAREIDPSVTAQQYRPIAPSNDESIFNYLDTASGRAGITDVSNKLMVSDVAIVGLGGTGSYVLDMIAKAPVRRIHLFDGDKFYSHNAFRAPGAASIEELRERPTKADYFQRKYAALRTGIVANSCFVEANNLTMLDQMQWVFLCMDSSDDKRCIIEHLESVGIPFIDAGMGVELGDGVLSGIVRVTASTSAQRNHVWDKNRISFGNAGMNPYDSNIQVVDLNALNACLAVIKWKKLLGFYRDLEGEHHCLYTIDGNHLVNEDTPCVKVSE